MSEDSNREMERAMNTQVSLEVIQAQKELGNVELALLQARAQNQVQSDPRVQAALVQTALIQAEQTQKLGQAQLEFQSNQLKQQLDLQDKQYKAIADQLENTQTTFKILFAQTKGAALMFYASFCLGFALVIASVVSYLTRRDPNDLLTIAFLGVGSLTMLYFFLRDPAEKIQQTAAKLVQIQAAMRYHMAEINIWDAYITKKLLSEASIDSKELAIALKSIRLGTQAIMRQIDESLDDRKAGNNERSDESHKEI
jgi:hypothetical protein